MTTSLEQSIKEKLRLIAQERKITFANLWRNLVLERFLARLCNSNYKKHFILKGGSLLAKYIVIGRETKDLDFSVINLSNTNKILNDALEAICKIDLNDGFLFTNIKIDSLEHPHMDYTGAQITLMAKFGGTKTQINIDLGFGDVVNPIDYEFNLTTTKKGPLFESKIRIKCYPKEFIFAEKLETVVFRSGSNSRMKDFHDLYSLIFQKELIDKSLTKKVIKTVFIQRNTSLDELPVKFDEQAINELQSKWNNYHHGLNPSMKFLPPIKIKDLIDYINQWLISN